MLNILGTNEEFRQVAKVDEDPAVLLLDIAEGNEELNTEFFRYDIISKADKALTKSIELDTQIEANGIASKGTVAYGIEALEMTAIFLGVNYDAETVAAGIEDDDQETPKEEKKGFLAKVKDAASRVWKTIMEIVQKIINKVKDFFSSKAVEKAEKDLDEAAEKIEKETGSADTKPKCTDKAKEGYALTIANVEPVFVKENGIKSSKDLNELFNFILDKDTFKNIELFSKILSSNFKQYVKDLSDILAIAQKSTKKSSIKDALQAIFATGDKVSEVTRLRDSLQKASIDFIKSFEIKEFKQHPIKEKIIKDNKERILKIAKLSRIENLEYSMLYTGATLGKTKGKKRDYFEMNVLILYKDKGALNRIEELSKKVENVDTVKKIIDTVGDVLGVKTVHVPIEVKASDIAKMIEPMSSKELREIRQDLGDISTHVTSTGGDIEKVIDKNTRLINSMQDDLDRIGAIGKNTYSVLNSFATAIATQARASIAGASSAFTRLVNAEIQFSNRCGDKGKPFGE